MTSVVIILSNKTVTETHSGDYNNYTIRVYFIQVLNFNLYNMLYIELSKNAKVSVRPQFAQLKIVNLQYILL